jgi:hypothetical protein
MRKILRRAKIQQDKAQSLVEVALFLPIFMIMVTGLAVFGIILNQYLNIMDGPREGARFAAQFEEKDIFGDAQHPCVKSRDGYICDNFYDQVAGKAYTSTQPFQICPDYHTPASRTDCDTPPYDDIVTTVYGICGNTVKTAYPANSYYDNYTSKFSSVDVNNILAHGTTPPDTGIVIVEMYYNFHLKGFALPWITLFVHDPVLLWSYTVMPLTPATPSTCS